MPRPSTQGFTLVEVLVALSVMSIAVIALLNVQGASGAVSSGVRERLFAEIVADNLLVEALAAPGDLAAAETSGEVTAAGQVWHWTRKVSATGDRDIKRIDVSVRSAPEDSAVAVVSAFRGLR
jgi:general secretion pathway protein I